MGHSRATAVTTEATRLAIQRGRGLRLVKRLRVVLHVFQDPFGLVEVRRRTQPRLRPEAKPSPSTTCTKSYSKGGDSEHRHAG